MRKEEKKCLFKKEEIVRLLFIDDSCSSASAGGPERSSYPVYGTPTVMCEYDREEERGRETGSYGTLISILTMIILWSRNY